MAAIPLGHQGVSRLGPHGIPFRLIVRGKEWKVRWGDPSGDYLSDDDYGSCTPKERTICLDNSLRLRKNRNLAWEVFVHEVEHAINREWRGSWVQTKNGEKKRWREMSHWRIRMNELPLAALILENAGLFGLAIK